MEIKKIMFNGEEVDFIVSIDEGCIDKNEIDSLDDTIILGNVLEKNNKIESSGVFYE